MNRKKPNGSVKNRNTHASHESLERQVNSVEDMLGEIRPTYDYDTISFETAEAYADAGGRFAFSMFPDTPSRSQEYDDAAVRALTAALDEVR